MKKIYNIIKFFFNYLGIELIRYKKGIPRNSLEQSYLHINKIGFIPPTIIDVGIAKGTPELYSAFPDSYFLLIEPLKEFETHMKEILLKYNGEYLLCAAGEEDRKINFNVHDHHLSGSSIYNEAMGEKADGSAREVNMIRIDELVIGKGLKSPYLLKVDTQGSELDVLGGCTKILDKIEVIVLEVSMFEFMKKTPVFYDIINYMKKINFVAYDIDLAWNRPLDDALGQLNIVFVKEKGFFRNNHSYGDINKLNKLY